MILTEKNFINVFENLNDKFENDMHACGVLSNGLFVTVFKIIPKLEKRKLTMTLYNDNYLIDDIGELVIDFNKAESYKVEFNDQEGAYEFFPLLPMNQTIDIY